LPIVDADEEKEKYSSEELKISNNHQNLGVDEATDILRSYFGKPGKVTEIGKLPSLSELKDQVQAFLEDFQLNG
jgi:hypothetical protein